MINLDTLIKIGPTDKRSCEIIRYRHTISCGRTLLISIARHEIYPDGMHARMHERTHAESMGKRLNWSDYPLVHKEIATSISWCTYVTIKLAYTWLKWGWVCVRDISLSMELMRDGDWVLRSIRHAPIVFKAVLTCGGFLPASRLSNKRLALCLMIDTHD